MRIRLFIAACAVMLAAGPAAALAAKPHKPRCHSGYAAKKVRVHRRRHGKLVRRHGRPLYVRAWRCERTVKTAAPAPKVSFAAKVDPTFTQAPNDPLAVTYAYSADATQTVGTVTTNLASTGQLPAGVLNFYSATAPGGPEQLYCAMNVGGSAVGSTCPITYGSTGVYDVTTEYIPSGTSAVTQTSAETISPYATTTSLSVSDGACGSGSPPGYSVPGPYCTYTVANSVSDQNGNRQGPQVLLEFAPSTGQASAGALTPANGSCTTYVTAQWVLSPDCNIEAGNGTWDVTSWSATASFAGSAGWASSVSPGQAVAP